MRRAVNTSRWRDVTTTLSGRATARRLWRRAVADVQSGHMDDRPLYWARLKLRRALGEAPAAVDAGGVPVPKLQSGRFPVRGAQGYW